LPTLPPGRVRAPSIPADVCFRFQETMEHLPIFLDIKHQPCLVVGGGPIALRKLENLRRAGARIRLVSPALVPDLRARLDDPLITWHERQFEDADFRDVRLAIAATDDRDVNRRIGELAKAAGIPVEFFTVMFAIGRMPGWLSNWREVASNQKARIHRPRQIYQGPTEREYVPIEKRG